VSYFSALDRPLPCIAKRPCFFASVWIAVLACFGHLSVDKLGPVLQDFFSHFESVQEINGDFFVSRQTVSDSALRLSALSFHLDRLLRWLEAMGLQPPSQDIRILEISQISPVSQDCTYHVRTDQLFSPLEYESRFNEILGTGYSWVNMSCCGIQDGSLIVIIEVPAPRTLYPGCSTSVNLSGPGTDQAWNVARVLTIGGHNSGTSLQPSQGS
jgi:hypothetical protein